jgi:hypothetical protein
VVLVQQAVLQELQVQQVQAVYLKQQALQEHLELQVQLVL